MVGRKFFMELVREFQELCQLLSCKTVQTSPTHSSVSRYERQQTVISSLSPIKEEEDEDVIDEMGNKPLKLPEFPDCDESAYQEHVLNILRHEKAPLKESNFSPYTPLPAIGKSSFNPTDPLKDTHFARSKLSEKDDFETKRLQTRIERQHTYRVLNPIFIKGPYDFHKFPSLKNTYVMEEGILRRNNANAKDHSPRDRKVLRANRTEKETNRNQLNFSNNFIGQTLKPSNKFLEGKDKLKSTNINKENTSAFWIDF